ncbi:DUF1573 domain-containing protein [Flavobacterium aurantiibacter]|uniref:MSP domain-containing protein n=1 Tax=Flavobacterium aurantiibacter TaxID=2023067 RepID=A0A256A279_9FLAO|nr:DUF1573 domain-containing protein [Flavobacterium aurantiibacter]OYQ47225.1 hypothetical protein CHX27_03320 [Flavobacterium aurantiibacter]
MKKINLTRNFRILVTLTCLLFSSYLCFAQPKIKFDKREYTMNRVRVGESAVIKIPFKNIGDKPLIIISAQGSGPNVVSKPSEPIAPNRIGYITVKMPTAFPGKFTKSATIRTNADDITTVLTLKLQVIADTKPELSKCNVFIQSDSIDNQRKNKLILLRKLVNDTIIMNHYFTKYQLESFTDYYKKRNVSLYYETFEDSMYIKLDETFNIIHSVHYGREKQLGIIFGKKDSINLELIDKRDAAVKRYNPLIPIQKTPRKFFLKGNPNQNFTLRLDYEANETENDNTVCTKQLFGEQMLKISKNYMYDDKVTNTFNLNVGDEMQLLYRGKRINEQTKAEEFYDYKFKECKYISDTIVNGKSAKLFTLYTNSNFIGSDKYEKKVHCFIDNDSIYYDKEPHNTNGLKIQQYKTEMKILDDNSVFFQVVYRQDFSNRQLPLVTQYKYAPNYRYEYFIVPSFPFKFYEDPDYIESVSYLKRGKSEYGVKKERTNPTDSNLVLWIKQTGKHKIKVTYRLVEPCKINMRLQNKSKMITIFTKRKKPGMYTYNIKSKMLQPGNEYLLYLSYFEEHKEGHGMSYFEMY